MTYPFTYQSLFHSISDYIYNIHVFCDLSVVNSIIFLNQIEERLKENGITVKRLKRKRVEIIVEGNEGKVRGYSTCISTFQTKRRNINDVSRLKFQAWFCSKRSGNFLECHIYSQNKWAISNNHKAMANGNAKLSCYP